MLFAVLTVLLVPAPHIVAQSQPPISTPISDLYITSLRARNYGGAGIQVEQTLAVTRDFTRTLISYTSDGLKQYGFMNTPKGAGPFPVVLVLHGYVNPRAYRTTTYTARDADALARAGFLVLHPDYRGHGRSQDGPNLFRSGYAIDVLNLIEQAKALPRAKPNAIGIWGHSMGGGISLRVLAVNPNIKAAVLYGAMNADEELNTDRIKNVFRPGSTLPEDDVPKEEWASISPVNALGNIATPIQIHHGSRDFDVPVAWSDDLSAQLKALGKDVTYFKYAGQGHILQGSSYTTFMTRIVAFYKERL
jgi:dipeptidyl aminopeptidase/acylaminoacyl peptidase